MFFCLAVLVAGVTRGDDYVNGLIGRARSERLAEHPEWQTLLHYRSGWFGVESLVDDPKFFLAPDGKRDPAAELDADVAAFFAPVGTNELDHAMCRFPQRFAWLDEKLGFDRARLPMTECATFRKVYDHLKPRSVALIYPDAFMNGPASMFGHTLLVFDTADQNRMLSRAVSYAAKTRPIFGPFFAFAGIMGFYPGYFAYQPYYEKVEQYGDIGHRDVWEYDLDFTQDEIDRMIRHAWELQNIYSWYYFFDENCAFNLLYILDVGRPSLGLARRMPWFVMPVDTVRQVLDAGLVSDVKYRPSPVSKIRHFSGLLDEHLRAVAVDLADGARAPDAAAESAQDPSDRRVVLDLAAEYTQYLFSEKRMTRETYSPRFLSILRARSKLGRAEEKIEVPEPPRPDGGHGPARWSSGVGVRNGDAFGSARWRIAYHALNDPDDGFTRGSQIQFLNTDARFDFEHQKGRLQSFDLVDVFSVSPRDAFFQPASWKFRFGVEQAEFDDSNELLVRANTGAGYSRSWARDGLGYAMVDADAQIGDYYEADWAVGMGPSVGWMQTIGTDWKHLVQARAIWFGPNDDLWRSSVSWIQNYRLNRDAGVSLEWIRSQNDGHDVREVQLRLNLYF